MSGSKNSFKSKFEEWVWGGLKKLAKTFKAKVSYETEYLPYYLKKQYRPDFIIQKKDGSKLYIEAKGYFRPEDRSKLIAVKESHPGIDLRMIFVQDNKLNKKAKSKYSDWCKKNDIPYSIGSIPKEWFE